MSDNVMSMGFMVPLLTKLESEDREEMNERLWAEKSRLSINYEGTIVYLDERHDEAYGLNFGVTKGSTVFLDHLKEHNVPPVDESKVVSYSCYWYNGSDSNMDMLTLCDFLERIA